MTCPKGYEGVSGWMERRGIEPADLHARIARLVEFASAVYYADGTSPISDAGYDGHLRMLEAIEHFHPALRTADSPTQRVMS